MDSEPEAVDDLGGAIRFDRDQDRMTSVVISLESDATGGDRIQPHALIIHIPGNDLKRINAIDCLPADGDDLVLQSDGIRFRHRLDGGDEGVGEKIRVGLGTFITLGE